MAKFKPQNYILLETDRSSTYAQILGVVGVHYTVRFVMFRGGLFSSFDGFGKPTTRTARYMDRFTKTTKKHIMSRVL